MKDYKIDCYDGFSVLDGELIMFLSKTRDISRKFYETLKEEKGKEYADEVIDEMLIPPDYMLTLNFEDKTISALARYLGPDSIKTSIALSFSPDEEKQIFEIAEDLQYLKKGDFNDISSDFIKDGMEVLMKITSFQEKYNKKDIDTVINELHDAIVGRYLGFNSINTHKHGMDCKFKDKEIFLESKVVSYSNHIAASFNDTTYEKADVFKDKKVWLAVSVWLSSSDVDFICFGQNELIGDFLEDKVTQQIQKSVRRTQSISLSKLLLDYNFKILTINLNREDRYEDLISMSKAFKNYDINNIIELKDYSPEKYLVA